MAASKIITPLQALEKAKEYCAYQERCQSEMRTKLYQWGIKEEVLESIICELISEGFINETRFAKTYARGKFRIKGWGKQKIIYALRRKQISEPCIKEALKEIEDIEYKNSIKIIAEKWIKTHSSANKMEKKKKLITFLYSKGFEYTIIQEHIYKLFNDNDDTD